VQVVDLQHYLAANRFKAGALLAGQKKGFTSANNILTRWTVWWGSYDGL